jgi:hypothetical protein
LIEYDEQLKGFLIIYASNNTFITKRYKDHAIYTRDPLSSFLYKSENNSVIDVDLKSAKLQTLLFNVNIQTIVILDNIFTFLESGDVSSTIKVKVAKLNPYSQRSFLTLVIELVYYFMLLFMTYRVFKTIRKYWHDPDNFRFTAVDKSYRNLDYFSRLLNYPFKNLTGVTQMIAIGLSRLWGLIRKLVNTFRLFLSSRPFHLAHLVSVILSIVSTIYWIVIVYHNTKQSYSLSFLASTSKQPEDELSMFYSVNSIYAALEAYRKIQGINAIFLCCGLFAYINFAFEFSLVISVIRLARREILSYMLIYLVITFGFAIGGYMIYGDKISDFKNVLLASLEIITMTVGKVQYSAMKSANSTMTPFFVFSYLILAYLLFLKMFIVITDSIFAEFMHAYGDKGQTSHSHIENAAKHIIHVSGKKISDINQHILSLKIQAADKGIGQRIKMCAMNVTLAFINLVHRGMRRYLDTFTVLGRKKYILSTNRLYNNRMDEGMQSDGKYARLHRYTIPDTVRTNMSGIGTLLALDRRGCLDIGEDTLTAPLTWMNALSAHLKLSKDGSPPEVIDTLFSSTDIHDIHTELHRRRLKLTDSSFIKSILSSTNRADGSEYMRSVTSVSASLRECMFCIDGLILQSILLVHRREGGKTTRGRLPSSGDRGMDTVPLQTALDYAPKADIEALGVYWRQMPESAQREIWLHSPALLSAGKRYFILMAMGTPRGYSLSGLIDDSEHEVRFTHIESMLEVMVLIAQGKEKFVQDKIVRIEHSSDTHAALPQQDIYLYPHPPEQPRGRDILSALTTHCLSSAFTQALSQCRDGESRMRTVEMHRPVQACPLLTLYLSLSLDEQTAILLLCPEGTLGRTLWHIVTVQMAVCPPVHLARVMRALGDRIDSLLSQLRLNNSSAQARAYLHSDMHRHSQGIGIDRILAAKQWLEGVEDTMDERIYSTALRFIEERDENDRFIMDKPQLAKELFGNDNNTTRGDHTFGEEVEDMDDPIGTLTARATLSQKAKLNYFFKAVCAMKNAMINEDDKKATYKDTAPAELFTAPMYVPVAPQFLMKEYSKLSSGNVSIDEDDAPLGDKKYTKTQALTPLKDLSATDHIRPPSVVASRISMPYRHVPSSASNTLPSRQTFTQIPSVKK